MIMREIGGYIGLDRARGKEYHQGAAALNSGRHCLEYLIKAKDIKKIYIPYFLCASVKELCEKLKCEFEYYHIDKSMRPLFDMVLSGGEYLYIVNYYGQIKNETIEEYKQKYGNIIIDNAQAFFQMPVKGVDTLYTCRKFFGVPDGGYLYTDARLNEEIAQDTSFAQINYILGRFERDAQSFYGEYQNHEHEFARREMRGMSKLTQNLLRGIDYDFAKKARTRNFEYCHKMLGKINELDLDVPDGAFMYPLLIRDGKDLKKKLIENKIYVPTLWDDVFDISGSNLLERDFAENIVPLPVDQRYDKSDVEYVLTYIL